jgi:hypothetical protein
VRAVRAVREWRCGVRPLAAAVCLGSLLPRLQPHSDVPGGHPFGRGECRVRVDPRGVDVVYGGWWLSMNL